MAHSQAEEQHDKAKNQTKGRLGPSAQKRFKTRSAEMSAQRTLTTTMFAEFERLEERECNSRATRQV